MKDVGSENIRNLALVGHGQTGKTTLVSAMLFDTKMVNRLCKVDQGNTITDYDEEEIARKISIQASMAHAMWENCKINLIDTPGFSNFIWEARPALAAVETALCLVCSQEGAQVQTEKMVEEAQDQKKSVVFVVSKLNKELADFDRAHESLVETFGRGVVAVQYPIRRNQALAGIIDLLTMKAWEYSADEKGEAKETAIPEELQGKVAGLREALIEKIAESDESLMEKYFEEGDLSLEEISSGLRRSLEQRDIMPVLALDGLSNQGVDLLLNFISRYLPSPLVTQELPITDGTIPVDKAPFSALVFKTLSDPFTGKISLLKIFSGQFKPDTFYYNSKKEVEERVGGLFLLQGKTQAPIGEARRGDIVAVAKLKETQTGDILTVKNSKIVLPELHFPIPSISFAIEPKARADEGKISVALQKIMEEDPTVKAHRDPQTKELIVAGNGQLHVEMVVSKLKKKYSVDVTMKTPKIAYRETIQGRADVDKKYKKQSGGRGQYAHVLIKMEPLPRGTGFEFEDTIFGGSIPKNYVPSVEKGIQDSMESGVLAGYPVVDFKVNLYDGSYHDVDSSDMAFKIAGSMAFKLAMKQAKPTLLEPIVKVEVIIPEEVMGEINGNLSSRRGKIQGMEAKGKNHSVRALVPMVEMLDFEPTLTSITGGRGTYFMEFSHYEEVPAHLQKKIVEDAVKEGRVKEEEE